MFHKLYYLNSILFLICSIYVVVDSQTYNYTSIRQTFRNKLVQKLGNGDRITVEDIDVYYDGHSWMRTVHGQLSKCLTEHSGDDEAIEERCLLDKCLSPEDVYQLAGLSKNTTDTEVSTMAMILLHRMEQSTCGRHNDSLHDISRHEPVSKAETWGFAILCCSIIVLAALCGFLTLPFVHGANYKRTLIYMVGLAVGTLTGSSLLFLTPEALELTEQELNEHSYVWKCLVMISSIYAFFLIERVLKMITASKERTKRERKLHQQIHGGRFETIPPEGKYIDPKYTDLNTLPHVSPCGHKVSCDSGLDTISDVSGTESITKWNGTATHNSQMKDTDADTAEDTAEHTVAPVAYMIIVGDALHNFIDGVSIGAAFTESILAGVSISVAVFCEELPHELGDFAVLLNAGMKTKRAVISNFLSACTIYIGMIIGIFLGENTTGHTWVFAFAAGMFLYIALVDMMPEMCAAGELEENRRVVGSGWIFLLQNLGMLTGFGLMLAMAIYGGQIEVAIRGEF